MARNITVTFDDGTSHVYKNAPDNLTPDMVQVRAQKDFGKAVKSLDGGRAAAPSEVPGPRQRGFFETIGAPIDAMSQGVISGGGNVILGGQRLLGKGLSAVGDVFAPNQNLSGLVTGQRPTNMMQQAGAFLQEDAARRLAESQATVAPFKQEFPVLTGTGELGGEILGTGPVGMGIASIPKIPAAIAKVFPAAAPLAQAAAPFVKATAPLSQAIRTGGFSGGNLATRVAGGAITGGATSAIINPDEFETGALVGGTVAAVAPPIVKALAKGSGFLKDAFTGQLAAVKAGKISRDVAGDQLAAIRAALAAAPDDLTAAQATAGVQKNAFQALGAFANRTDEMSLKLKQQADADFADLQRMMEGGNATEARAAYEASIKRLNQLTADMRNVELQAANQAAQTTNRLAPQLQQREASMVNALRQGMPAPVPAPLSGGLIQGTVTGPARTGQSTVAAGTEALQRANVADDAARRLMVSRSRGARGVVSEGPVPGVDDKKIERANRFVAEQWQETSDTFANIARQRRAEAGFLERQIGSLEDYGLRPLDAGRIVGAIDARLSTPGIRASSNVVKVLETIKDDIANLTQKGGGVIDAHDLYTLRKEGINERIQQIMGQTDPKISAKVTRRVLEDVRPLIDKAIEDAGGTDWSRYLKTYSQNMQAIDQKAMAAEAAKLFKDSPQEYTRLVRGNNDAAVEAIFGPGSYDIFKEMGSKMPTLEKLASRIEDTATMEIAAAKGKEALAETIERAGRTFPRIRNTLNPKVTFANLTMDELEGKLGPKVAAKLKSGMVSGKSALEMLNTLPAVERGAVLRMLNNPATWGAKGAAGARAAAIPAAPTNNLAPQSENQNALSR
jgi:hypothetical protein